ncbi:hypothetical protein V4U86_11370 [Mycobacterium sp. AMU20-3851]|uniref:hypothetical protein n=1 Tax=Mycobacterium sp. AMU20-3851 TaxID=3122055 RepID=UPI00375468D8
MLTERAAVTIDKRFSAILYETAAQLKVSTGTSGAERGGTLPAGALLSAYAFHVHPRQATPFAGGAIARSDELAAALDSTFDRSRVESAPAVTFEVDTNDAARSHPIRDVAVAVAFSDEDNAEVVQSLARRLSDSMDNRSKPSLLMVTVHASSSATKRRFVIWTFPQQEVFNLSGTGSETRLDVVEAFIRESSLRKVALLEGKNTAAEMLTARVLDFQATEVERSAADLWIVKFLKAKLQVNSREGTQMLARAVRMAYERTSGDERAQEELGAAIAAIRLGGQQRLSLEEVARGLGPVAREAFTTGFAPEARTAIFQLERNTFDSLIQFRRFTLANGVVVSAPFVEIGAGSGVEVSEVDGRRRLKAEGDITREQVRRRG